MRLNALRSLFAVALISLAGCAAEPIDASTADSTSSLVADGPDVDTSPGFLAKGEKNTADFKDVPKLTAKERAVVLAKYASIPHEGVREELFEKAMLYFDTNAEQLPNKSFVTIVDFRIHSGTRRFFVLDMAGGPLKSHVTAHGKFSDEDDDGYANSFSNVVGSGQSSLGFYYVAELYSGAYGESLRLDGLSPTNSNVRERAVVIHGSDYVTSTRPKQGRSLGCFALPWDDKPEIVHRLKAGSLLYADQ